MSRTSGGSLVDKCGWTDRQTNGHDEASRFSSLCLYVCEGAWKLLLLWNSCSDTARSTLVCTARSVSVQCTDDLNAALCSALMTLMQLCAGHWWP